MANITLVSHASVIIEIKVSACFRTRGPSLKARYPVRPKFIRYFWSRRKGLWQQVMYRIRRMRSGSKAPAPAPLLED